MDYGKKPAALQILDIGSKMLSYIIPPDSIILSNATYQNGEGSLSKVLCFFFFFFFFFYFILMTTLGPGRLSALKKGILILNLWSELKLQHQIGRLKST